MVNVVRTSVEAGEEVAVSRAVFANYVAVDNRVAGIFCPWAFRRWGSGNAHCIVGVEEVISRVSHVVHAVELKHCHAFHDRVPTAIIGFFPWVGVLETLNESSGVNTVGGHIVFAAPQEVTMVEANVIQVVFSVVVAEQERVDVLFRAVDRTYTLLNVWAGERVALCHSHLLVCGVEHVVFAVFLIDLRSPESFVAKHVIAFLEHEKCRVAFHVCPVFEVGRFQELEAGVAVVGAGEVIFAVFNEDGWVGAEYFLRLGIGGFGFCRVDARAD